MTEKRECINEKEIYAYTSTIKNVAFNRMYGVLSILKKDAEWRVGSV